MTKDLAETLSVYVNHLQWGTVMRVSSTPASTVLAVSIPEAAKRLGVSKNTVYRMIAEGTITAKKLRTRTIIEVSAIENYLASLPTYTGSV